jgi:hypothetical protein
MNSGPRPAGCGTWRAQPSWEGLLKHHSHIMAQKARVRRFFSVYSARSRLLAWGTAPGHCGLDCVFVLNSKKGDLTFMTEWRQVTIRTQSPMCQLLGPWRAGNRQGSGFASAGQCMPRGSRWAPVLLQQSVLLTPEPGKCPLLAPTSSPPANTKSNCFTPFLPLLMPPAHAAPLCLHSLYGSP